MLRIWSDLPRFSRLSTVLPRGDVRLLIPVVILAFLLRGVSIYGYAYPTGPDYGLHLLFTRQVLDTGLIPEYAENYQLSEATWPLMPGGPLTFGLFAAVSGVGVFDLVHVITFFAIIESVGMFALARQVFRRDDLALAAAAISAVLPLFVDMMTWAGYPNLIAVSVFPLCFTLWLRYWERPDARGLVLLTLVLCGTASIHHLSTLWLALTLAGFSLVKLVAGPGPTLRRLIPLALACALVGLPIAIEAIRLIVGQDAGAVLTTATRFDDTRVTWEVWARVITPIGLLVLVGGAAAFLTTPQAERDSRWLIGVYLVITLLFMFGWVVGLRFYYTRALYYLAIPIALGGASLLLRFRSPGVRAAFGLTIVSALAVSAFMQARSASDYFEIVTPDVIEAAAWLDDFSAPDDVIVSGTLLGFQLPRLLDRPLMAALTPDLISNAEILPIAGDAVAIMLGLSDMDDALRRRSVDFVVVRTRIPDIPNPSRSQQVMNAHPSMRLIFRNADVLIYEVR